MSALLRYAILRTTREQLLWAFLVGPTVVFIAPLTGIAGYHAAHGQRVFPFTLGVRMGPLATANIFGEVIVFVVTLVAGIAAFRVFRAEIVGKGIGFLCLASSPRIVTVAATLYGTLAGVAAYVVATAALAAVTATPPPELAKRFAVVLVAGSLAAALGTLMVGMSSDYSMLVPAYAGGILITFALRKWGTPVVFAATLAATAIVLVSAEFVWRRRCAA